MQVTDYSWEIVKYLFFPIIIGIVAAITNRFINKNSNQDKLDGLLKNVILPIYLLIHNKKADDLNDHLLSEIEDIYSKNNIYISSVLNSRFRRLKKSYQNKHKLKYNFSMYKGLIIDRYNNVRKKLGYIKSEKYTEFIYSNWKTKLSIFFLFVCIISFTFAYFSIVLKTHETSFTVINIVVSIVAFGLCILFTILDKD